MQDKYKTKRVDAQGRVLIPASIRETLNIQPDSAVSVKLEGDTIKINVAEEQCCICEKSVKGKAFYELFGGCNKSKKIICNSCMKKIKEAKLLS